MCISWCVMLVHSTHTRCTGTQIMTFSCERNVLLKLIQWQDNAQRHKKPLSYECFVDVLTIDYNAMTKISFLVWRNEQLFEIKWEFCCTLFQNNVILIDGNGEVAVASACFFERMPTRVRRIAPRNSDKWNRWIETVTKFIGYNLLIWA